MVSRWVPMLVSTLLLVTLSACRKDVPPPSVVSLTLTPAAVTLVPGQVQEFVAVVSGSSDAGVAWSVTGGVVEGSGNIVTYTAPAVVGEFVLTVVSNADPRKEATAIITVVGDVVRIVVEPAAVTLAPGAVQEFVATVTGAGDASVTWSVTGGTVAGSGNTVTYTAPAVAGGQVLTAVSVADPSQVAVAFIAVAPAGDGVAISLTPAVVTLVPGQAHAFTAVVTGSSDGSVSWSVTGGAVAGDGNTVTYTAPAAPGEYVLTAVSVAHPSREATAVITVVAGGDAVTIVLTPAAVTLVPGQVQEFVATVTGAIDTSVAWSVTGGALSGAGTIGTYTAPAVAGEYVLTVTSSADPSKQAAAFITVTPSGVAVTLIPDAVTLAPGQAQDFTAMVTGASDVSVAWSATGGTVDGVGNTARYTAPATAGVYVLTVTSNTDPSRWATAAITVTPPLELRWARQVGTSRWDASSAIAVDSANNVLIAGYTEGSLFGPSQGYTDAFIAKLAPDGSTVWAYQHGTSGQDRITAVAVDGADNVLIAGYAGGSLFGPHQGHQDAFVAKLAPNGTPIWAYQYGTSESDSIEAVAVDGADNVLIAGYTEGSLFGPHQGYRDAFVAKLAPNGTPVWAYQHGTSEWDEILAVAVDGADHVVIAGATWGALFGPNQGFYDAFVAKLAPDGSLVWAHQHGTNHEDVIEAVAIDGANHVVIAGRTLGSLFGSDQGGLDAFVAKLAPDGSLVWGQQLAAPEWDRITAVAVDGSNHVLVVGETLSDLFGPNQGHSDGFVAKLAPDGALVWSGHLGTSEGDHLAAVAVDSTNHVLIAGATAGSQFGPHQGNLDIVVAKLAP